MLFRTIKSNNGKAEVPGEPVTVNVTPVRFFAADGKMGLIDKVSGKVLVEPVYENIRKAIVDGRAIVGTVNGYGMISLDGKVIVEPGKYIEINHPKEGMSAVKDGCGWTFIDVNGNEIPRRFANVLKFYNEGVTGVQVRNRKWFFIDKYGNVLSRQYDAVDEVRNGLVVVELYGRLGVLAKTHQGFKEVLECNSSKVALFKDGFSAFENGKWQSFDRKGNLMWNKDTVCVVNSSIADYTNASGETGCKIYIARGRANDYGATSYIGS